MKLSFEWQVYLRFLEGRTRHTYEESSALVRILQALAKSTGKPIFTAYQIAKHSQYGIR